MDTDKVERAKEQAIKELKMTIDYGDTEIAHWDADRVLCEFLEVLGYPDIVELYRKVDKWYA